MMSLKEKINIVASENMTNKDVIQYLALNNDKNYNLLKCTEELSELQTILLQNINKEKDINIQDIIDEIGDCVIRLEVLKLIYNKTLIKERVDYKLNKFRTYIKKGKYLKKI